MNTKLALLFASTLVLLIASSPSMAAAQIDPTILMKLATKAQDEVKQQVSNLDSVPPEIEELDREASKNLESLRIAINNEDTELAKKHFLSVMRIYKAMAQLIGEQAQEAAPQVTSQVTDTKNPDSELERMKGYVANLMAIAKKHNADIDFSKIRKLFDDAENQIQQKNFSEARKTINEIKHEIVEINKELREAASQQASDRTKKYAQKYLKQLDRIIIILEKRDISNSTMQELKNTRDKLASSSDPNEIIKEVRKIISIKKQFELTQIDRIESRILQAEQSLRHISQIDQLNKSQIATFQKIIQQSKELLDNGDLQGSNELLERLADKITEIVKREPTR